MGQSFLNEKKKEKAMKQKRFLVFFLAALGAAFASLIVVLFLFQNRTNYVWMLPLVCVCLCLILLVFFYAVFFMLRPCSSLLKIYSRMARRGASSSCLRYIGTKEDKETESNLLCKVLCFKDKDNREIHFYVLEEEEVGLEEDKEYQVKEVSSFLAEAIAL